MMKRALQKHLQKRKKTQRKIGCEKQLTQHCSCYARNDITFAIRKGDRAHFMIAYLQDDLYRKRLNYVLGRFKNFQSAFSIAPGRRASQPNELVSQLPFSPLIGAASLLLRASLPIPCLSVSFSAHFFLRENSDELDKIACQDR